MTARVYAYRAQDWRLNDFAVTTLAPFTLPQMQAFAHQWYTRLNTIHSLNATPAALAAELLRNIKERRQLHDLAQQPLLLTFMAGLHMFSPLPDRRQELYEKIVELLFNEWEQGKLTAQANQPPPNLASLLKVSPNDLRRAVEGLAYDAHAQQRAEDGQRTANLTEDQLVGALYRLVKDRADKPDIDRLKEHIQDRAGLLIAHGVRQYTFPHRTFQEYLAACHITRAHSQSHLVDLLKADVDRWREVALLAAARWYSGGRDSLWNLARKLCPTPLKAAAPLPAPWLALLAGQAMQEAGVGAPNDDDEAHTLATLTASLAESVLGHPAVPPVERARAGRVLSALGDPRPGVGVVRAVVPLRVSETVVRLWGDKPEHIGLPDITWVRVPGVRGFRLQTHEGDKGTYDIAPFYLAQYPVTNAQFQAFVEADDGFRDPRWWAGLAASEADRRAPRAPAFPYANHPRERVTWWGAVAFGRWLSARLGWADLPADLTLAGLTTSTAVRLPTEWEWQWAACPRQPQTKYPWEGDITPDHANYGDTQIGQTSAVGCFPRGATLGGAHDLSGNVWEWCLNEYKQHANVALGGEQSRVGRGGAWDIQSIVARVVFRYRVGPDYHVNLVGFRVVRAPVGLDF